MTVGVQSDVSRAAICLLALALAAAAMATGAAPIRAQEIWPDSSFMEQFPWRSIGPANMSGRVTDVEGIPGTPVFYFAAATGGVWKTTNSGTTFRPLFTDERVSAMGDLAISQSDTSIVWAGTGEEDSRNSISPGAGVYKSTDGGLTWTLMGLEDSQAIGRIVIHPTDPNTVYVAALGHIWGPNNERGLYRTSDGGETWERIHFISDEAGFVDIAMHPKDPQILFASSWERVRGPYFLRSGGPGSALWKSTDGGDSWTEVEGGGFPSTEKGRIGIAIAASNPDVMYALVEAEGADSTAVEESEEVPDDPAAEEQATEEQTEESGAEEEVETADPTDGLRGSGLYRSEDGGLTWAHMNSQNSRPFYYSQVRVDPTDPDFVIWSSTPVRASKDGGKTVGQTTQGIHVDHHALWWDPMNPDHIVTGNDGGIGITWDRGGNWDFPNTMALGQFYAVSYNMDLPYRVCGGLQDNGTWCGPSNRRQGTISNYMWATVNGGDGFYAPQDMTDPTLMWAESQGGNMARINTASGTRQSLSKPDWREATKTLRDELVTMEDAAGAAPTSAQTARMADLKQQITADSVAAQLRWNWSTPMVVSVHDRNVLYAGANRVLKSTERGDGLRAISPDLTYADTVKIRISTETTGGITRDATGAETHATIVALAESPRRAGWLFAGTDDGRIWHTRDDGATWTELTGRFPGVPEGTWVSRIEPSHHDDDRFYVSFDGHRADDFTPYVYVTENGGETFAAITTGLPTGAPDYVHVVREDPLNESLLFVGTDVGVYVSLDRGANWRRFMEGLPTVPVHDLKIHPRDRELIAGTHGRSIWVADIAALSQIAGRGLGDEAVLFDPSPGLQYGSEAIGGESTGHSTFRGQIKRFGAELTYYIPKEVSTALLAEAREAREAASESGASGPRVRAQAEFIILDAAGDTTQIVTGPVTPGLARIYWNYSLRTSLEPLSPSEARDSANAIVVIDVVADSLLATGADSAAVTRAAENAKNRAGRSAPTALGGARPLQTTEFQERPGESFPNRPARTTSRRPSRAGGAGEINRTFNRALRDRGIRLGGGGGGGGGGPQDIAEPGRYTVVLRLGSQTLTTELELIRRDGYEPTP